MGMKNLKVFIPMRNHPNLEFTRNNVEPSIVPVDNGIIDFLAIPNGK
jgi:hypothetical protein